MSQEIVDFAQTLAERSREVIRPYFRSGLGVMDKADESPVTIADKNAEAALREMIEASYPDHGIFGEEHGVKEGNGEDLWVLDPIDGTRSFICGAPWFGTLIAYLKNGVPSVSVLDVPMMGERWVSDGQTTLFQGEIAKTRTGVTLDQASLYTTDYDLFTPVEKTAFDRVKSQAKCVRYGTDCYAYGLLSSGHIDLVIEAGLQPYDAMALVPVIKGAGGIVTDWNGGEISMDWDGRIVAAGSSELHRQAIESLKG